MRLARYLIIVSWLFCCCAHAATVKINEFGTMQQSLPCKTSACEFTLPPGTFPWTSSLQISTGNVTIGGSTTSPTVITCSKTGGLALLRVVANKDPTVKVSLTLQNVEVSGCNCASLIQLQGAAFLTLKNVQFSQNTITDKAVHVNGPPLPQGQYRLVMSNVTFRNNHAVNLLFLEGSTKFDVVNTFNMTLGVNNDSTLLTGDYEAFNPCEGPNCLPSVPGHKQYMLPREPRTAYTQLRFDASIVEAETKVLSRYLMPVQLTQVSVVNNTNTKAHPVIYGLRVMFHSENLVLTSNSISWKLDDATAFFSDDLVAATGSLLMLNQTQSNLTDLTMTQNKDIGTGIFLWFPLGLAYIRRPIFTYNTVAASVFRFYGWTMYRDYVMYEQYIQNRFLAFDMQDVGCAFRQGDILLSSHENIKSQDNLLNAATQSGMNVQFCNNDICKPGVFNRANLYSNKFSRTLEWDSYLRHLNSRRSAAVFFADGQVVGNVAVGGTIVHLAPYMNMTSWFPDKNSGVITQFENVMIKDNVMLSLVYQTQKTSIVYTGHIRGVFRHCDFINNTGLATLSMVHENVLKIQDLHFESNYNYDMTWICAGAIANTSDITFINNTAAQLYRSDDSDLGYHSIYMRGNKLYFDPTKPHVKPNFMENMFQTVKNKMYYFSNMTLIDNEAYGAVMGFDTVDFLFNISDVKCYNNSATCLYLNMLTSDRNFDNSCNDEMYSIRDSVFVNNSGATGGAVKMILDSRMKVTWHNTSFTDNQAVGGSSGGAMLIVPDTVQGYGGGFVVLNGVVFQRNRALTGGALWVGVNVSSINSQFTNNVAGFVTQAIPAPDGVTSWVASNLSNPGLGGGGAIYCDGCVVANITGNLFEKNVGPRGGAIMATPIFPRTTTPEQPRGFWDNIFWENNATGGDPATDVYDSSWEACPLGAGGALCLKTSVNMTLSNNTFDANEGVWGGGVLINTDYSAVPVFDDLGQPVCQMNLTANTFVNNVVKFGLGPALFYNNTLGLCLWCDTDSPPVSASNATYAFEYGCEAPMWSQNIALGSYPAVLPGIEASGFHGMATFPYRMKLDASTTFEPTRTITSSLNAVNFASGECREDLWDFSSGDAANTNQTHRFAVATSHDVGASSIDYAVVKSGGQFNMTARLYDRHELLVPRALNNISVIIDAQGSLVVYNWRTFIPYNWSSTWVNITLQPANVTTQADAYRTFYNHNFTLNVVPISSQQQLATQELDVTVRSCFIGEYMSDAFTCSRCQPGSFSLIPEVLCNPCPTEGVCEDKIFTPAQILGYMVPKDRFWKSSIFSPAMHRCPLTRACSYPRRKNYMGNTSRVAVLQSILYNQVVQSPQYGCTSTMFMSAQCTQGYEGNLCGLCSKGYGRQSNACMRCYSQFANSLLILVLLAIISGVLIVLVASHIRSMPRETMPTNNSIGGKPGQTAVIGKDNHKEALVRMFKVVLSFVQVLGIMRTAQIDWPPSLGIITRFIDPTSSFAMVSPDCSMPRSDSQQALAIKRTLFFTLLPAGYIIAAAIIWKLWSVLRRGRRLDASLTWSYFILTVQQVCYLLYPITTSTLLSIFTCWNMDDMGDRLTRLYAENWKTAGNNGTIITTGQFWSENLSHRCYQGSHLLLVLVYGVPAILIFSVGVPVGFFFGLCKHRHKLQDPHIKLKYGFLYEEYRPEYYYWECVIMAKKALLLMVTVLLAPLGASPQLHAAIFVQICSTLAHELAHPYTDHVLNNMERVSLYSNQLTLLGLSAIAASTDAVDTVLGLTVVLLLLNCGVMLYFFVIIAVEMREWVRSGHFRSTWESLAVSLLFLVPGTKSLYSTLGKSKRTDADADADKAEPEGKDTLDDQNPEAKDLKSVGSLKIAAAMGEERGKVRQGGEQVVDTVKDTEGEHGGAHLWKTWSKESDISHNEGGSSLRDSLHGLEAGLHPSGSGRIYQRSDTATSSSADLDHYHPMN